MKNVSHLIAIAVVCSLVFVLPACGNQSEVDNSNVGNTSSQMGHERSNNTMNETEASVNEAIEHIKNNTYTEYLNNKSSNNTSASSSDSNGTTKSTD